MIRSDVQFSHQHLDNESHSEEFESERISILSSEESKEPICPSCLVPIVKFLEESEENEDLLFELNEGED